MSNTQTRIVSALILILVMSCSLYMGPGSTIILLLFLLIAINYELFIVFFKEKITSKNHIIIQICSALFFLAFMTIFKSQLPSIIAIAFLFHLYKLYFLTFKNNSFENRTIISKYKLIFTFLLTCSVVSLASIIFKDNWIVYIVILMTFNFSSDTGAWFWGKKYGSHKLWPSVSPNKTIEGAIGGAVSSGIITTLLWYFIFDYLSLKVFVVFVILAIISQLGDLFQSKLKRIFKIKDSSRLIPGHGGVYDRVDSLLFVAPFYLVLINWI